MHLFFVIFQNLINVNINTGEQEMPSTIDGASSSIININVNTGKQRTSTQHERSKNE